MKNSLVAILFSTECSSCTLLAPNIRATSAEKRRVEEFRTCRDKGAGSGGTGREGK